MDCQTKEEYIEYLKQFKGNRRLEEAAFLLVSRDLRIRNLQQAVLAYKSIADAAKRKETD